METFGEIFATFFGLFGFFLAAMGASWTCNNFRNWRMYKDRVLLKKSDRSNDFFEEMENALSFIYDRKCMFGTEDKGSRLKDSSHIASLFRAAHYAGCNITFEQNEVEWPDDPEYLDPDVFKTDMGEAEALREERKWNKYKRYYEPPMSRRDRVLGR